MNKINCAILALSLAGGAFSHNEGFRMLITADLGGGQVVPAVTTDGRGLVGLTYNGHGDSMSIVGSVQGLSGPITGLSINEGEFGANGTMEYDLPLAYMGKTISANIPVSVEQVGMFMRGAFYVVVKTAAHPDGELRGQLEMQRNWQFVAELTGDEEVPAVTTPGKGLGAFYISPDDTVITVKVAFGNLKDSVTAAHFHYGKKGQGSGPVVIDLGPYISKGTINARVPIPAHDKLAKTAARSGRVMHNEFLEALESDSVYINIHTKAHPGGEIRGQVEESTERVFIAEMMGSKQVPAVTTTASGLGIFMLSPDDSTLMLQASFQGLDSVTAFHIHRGSKTASDTLPAPPAIDLTSMITGNTVSAAYKTSALANLEVFIEDLGRGAVYAKFRTKTNPLGEIRSSMVLPLRIGTVALLEGAQETPAVTTPAVGAALVTMDPDSTNVVFKIVADSLTAKFSTSHIHKQVMGTAGGVVKNLASYFTMNPDSMSGLAAEGMWLASDAAQPFTRALARAYMAESLYVNIHSTANPAGEIRGQIKDRVPDNRVVGVRRGDKLRGPASRLLFSAGGSLLRLQGEAGKVLRLNVADLRGRSQYRARLSIEAGGYSRSVDLSALRPGLYIASIGEGAGRKTARFLRQ